MWREFSSLAMPRRNTSHVAFMGAVAGLLEDRHIPFTVEIFGHADTGLTGLQSYPVRPPWVPVPLSGADQLVQYETLILPLVDCISEAQLSIVAEFAQRGYEILTEIRGSLTDTLRYFGISDGYFRQRLGGVVRGGGLRNKGRGDAEAVPSKRPLQAPRSDPQRGRSARVFGAGVHGGGG